MFRKHEYFERVFRLFPTRTPYNWEIAVICFYILDLHTLKTHDSICSNFDFRKVSYFTATII